MNPAQPNINNSTSNSINNSINNCQETQNSKKDDIIENQFDTLLPISTVTATQISNRPTVSSTKPKLSLRDALYNSSTPQAVNFSPAFSNQIISRQTTGTHNQNNPSLTSRVSGLLPITPQTTVSLTNLKNNPLAKKPLVNLLPNDKGSASRTSALQTSTNSSLAFQISQPNDSAPNAFKNSSFSCSQSNSSVSRVNSDLSLPPKKKNKKNSHNLFENISSHPSSVSASQHNLILSKDGSSKASASSSSLASKKIPSVQSIENKKIPRSIEEINMSQTVKERVLKHLKSDQEKCVNPDYLRPFDSFNDAFSRLLPYHLFQYNDTFFEKNPPDEQRSSKLLQAKTVLFNRLSRISKRNLQEKQFPSSLSTLINHFLVSDATVSQTTSKSPIVKNEHSSTAPTPQPTDRLSSIAPSETY